MADILRVSFPQADKNYINPAKSVPEVSSPFNIVDLARVTKPQNESALQQNTHKQLEQSDTPAILQELLQDPKVTVGFLRGISMLEELFRLLPGRNNAVSQELKEMFNALLIKPEDLLQELLKQALGSTGFKGDLFTFLRSLESLGDKRMNSLIANLLKALNGEQSQQNVRASLSNNLLFLAQSQSGLRELSAKLLELSKAFKDPNQDFATLRQQALDILGQQQTSLLNTNATNKVSSILLHNLSRYQSNGDYLPEAVAKLANALSELQKANPEMLKQIFDKVGSLDLKEFMKPGADFGALLKDMIKEADVYGNSSSKVMDVLANIIQKEGKLAELQLIPEDKINDIIASLLSSPCNYTPLMHFVFPIDFFDMKAFAEMWVNNYADENENGDGKHVLIAFDIEQIGAFEVEIYTKNNEIQVLILCPEEHVESYAALTKRLPGIVANSGYRLLGCRVDTLVRGRSLMEVFTDLPKRRMGLSVKA